MKRDVYFMVGLHICRNACVSSWVWVGVACIVYMCVLRD